MRGMSKALQQFDALPAVFQARCSDGLTKAATLVRDRARMYCPVGTLPGDAHGGDLRSAIGFKVVGVKAFVGIVAQRFRRGGKNRAHQWPSVYGRWVEFGNRRQKSEPFMRPAAEVGRVQLPIEIAKAGVLAVADLASRAL